MKELPDRWRDLGEFIREQRGLSRLSLRRLSDLAGISNPYLSQIERGLRKPSAEILQQIAKALRISAETLYERAGLLEAHEGEDDTLKAILRDPSLTEDAKQTLLKVYLSLRTAPAEPGEADAADPGRPGPAGAGAAVGGPGDQADGDQHGGGAGGAAAKPSAPARVGAAQEESPPAG
jgi:transcriptional regulator with XRE-family HTH domain